MLLNNYFKWRLGMEDYPPHAVDGTSVSVNLGMRSVTDTNYNILVTSNNGVESMQRSNTNRSFKGTIGAILSTSNTTYTKDAYMLGNTIASWITGLNIQYSDVVENGKLTRIFTISGQNISQDASVKAVGITKDLYASDGSSYSYLMAIYEPEEPIQLTVGHGFSFSFKWTEE